MSLSVPLGKSPESPEERHRLIAEQLRIEDYLSHLQATQIQKKILDFLITDRGYAPEDLEVNKEFAVELPENSFTVRADIIVNVEGRRFLALKCAMSSLESWERHSVAFCRVAGPSQIPFAAITDGETLLLVDTLTCATTQGGLGLIPSRPEAARTIDSAACRPYPEDRAEREKRILHAFEAIRCPADPPVNE